MYAEQSFPAGDGLQPSSLPEINDTSGMEEACDLLRSGEVLNHREVPTGSNAVFLLFLRYGERTFPAIYKPRRGERPLYDFPDGTLYRREFGSYLVSRALNWNLIPPTVICDGPYGIGMCQWFVPTNHRSGYAAQFRTHLSTFQRVAAFDWLVNNADRKGGHCLEARDGRLWFVDHGLTFQEVPNLRTIVWDFAGQPLPDDIITDFTRLVGSLAPGGELQRRLARLIAPAELKSLRGRLDLILREPVYPSSFGSYYRIPWPPF